MATKISPFKANYGQDPRMGFERRRKGKYKVVGKFVERIKKIQEKAKAACYESPKRRKVSQAFEYLIQNLKTYNRVEI